MFVVGAGASYPPPSSLPGFKGLVQDIFAKVDPTMTDAMKKVSDSQEEWDKVPGPLTDSQRTELKFFADEEYDVALGMLERRMDSESHKASKMRQAAEEVLGRTGKHNRLHTSLVELGQRFGQTLLVTTNFDRLLSHAAKSAKRSDHALAMGQIPRASVRADFSGIFHIHGILGDSRNPASDLILTDQDFGDAYLRRHTTTSFLYDVARIYSLVLVGYSASDSPVRYLLNAIAADERHFADIKPRYAFVGTVPGDTRTAVEWKARGITPIIYDEGNDHKALGDVLVEWAKILPDPKNSSSLAKHVRDISKADSGSATGKSKLGLLRYLVLRANQTERGQLAEALANAGADPGWISMVSKIVREQKQGSVA